ncbi:hypothetical protein EIK77_007446 [Talaromyces pinophilus]|nr:hypothetical protein EIK77_007446 [Talaromyces pinophilus]
MHYVCDGIAIEAGVCEETEYGTFIGRLSEASYPIMTRAVHIAQFPEPVAFSITRSGVYCVETIGYTTTDFSASMRYDSKYGGIPAIQVGKLRFSSFMMCGGLAALIATTIFYYGTNGNRLKADFCRVLMIVFYIVTIQSAVAWANLTHLNQHSYKYASNSLRGMAIFFVALRNVVIIYLVLEWASAAKQTSTRECSYHYVLYAATFVISTAKENELLSERDELRDKIELVWTLVSSVIMLLYHIESLQHMSPSLSWRPFSDKMQPSRSRNLAVARWISVLLLILIVAFTIVNVALLWSWSVADEYGHDLLTKLWWVRWFVIDEWQTTVYLADIVLAIFAWSAALGNGEESSTLVV